MSNDFKNKDINIILSNRIDSRNRFYCLLDFLTIYTNDKFHEHKIHNWFLLGFFSFTIHFLCFPAVHIISVSMSETSDSTVVNLAERIWSYHCRQSRNMEIVFMV